MSCSCLNKAIRHLCSILLQQLYTSHLDYAFPGCWIIPLPPLFFSEVCLACMIGQICSLAFHQNRPDNLIKIPVKVKWLSSQNSKIILEATGNRKLSKSVLTEQIGISGELSFNYAGVSFG